MRKLRLTLLQIRARTDRPAAVGVVWPCGVRALRGVCLAHGGVYRPRGVHFDDPAFYVLPTIMLLPLVTLYLDRRAHRGGEARTG